MRLPRSQGLDIPVLIDDTHLVSESLQLTRAGEVLVIDPKGWKIAYRGPLDKAKRATRCSPARSIPCWPASR